MAKRATTRPPKERVLAAAALFDGGGVSDPEGALPLVAEVGEPVETVPLEAVEAPVVMATVVLPPVGRGTTAVVPSGTETGADVGRTGTVSRSSIVAVFSGLTLSGSGSGRHSRGTGRGLSRSAGGTLSRDGRGRRDLSSSRRSLQ